MELVPKTAYSIVTGASKAWVPELIAAAGPNVTATYVGFYAGLLGGTVVVAQCLARNLGCLVDFQL
jgi:hypothetical protein